MGTFTERMVARAMRPGGPEVIELSTEELAPLKVGEVLVRVQAAGLNHAETLIRSDRYVVRLPFPYAIGGEGSGTVVSVGPEVKLTVGTRVCWGAIPGSCATLLVAPASMLVQLPDALSFEDGACLPVAGITAAGLARVWPLDGSSAVVWGAAGAVGRMLVAILAERGVKVIGIASGDRTKAVTAAGATYAIDRETGDVIEAVKAQTDGKGAAAVFDPIGAATYETSLQLLAPRGCLINYGELSGSMPDVNLGRLFAGSLFVTKYNGMRSIGGLHEFAGMVEQALALALRRPAIVSHIAGRLPLRDVCEAYRALESDSTGKILVLPNE